MRKVIYAIICLMALSGCGSSSTLSTSSLDESSSVSSLPNGLQPLVPYQDTLEPTLEGGWVSVWADEFNGTELDRTKWNIEVNGDGGGNQELQYYREENIGVSDGNLTITAKKEYYLGKQYTSGRINTKYRMDIRYGRIKVRARLPGGRGTWAAIWMMPLFNEYGTWPRSGEIDIMEYVGYDKDWIQSTIHTEKFTNESGIQPSGRKNVIGVEDDFHDYELIWGPGNLKTYCDGEKFFEMSYVAQLNDEVPYYKAFPFDQDFFLILNLAIGGTWGGRQGVDDSIFPVAMEFDYARVFALDYALLDQTPPTTPTNFGLARVKNTIHWNRSIDDYGVEKYAIFVDGSFSHFASLNQATFTGLNGGQTYAIQVQAVDFVGRTSPMSDTFSLAYQ